MIFVSLHLTELWTFFVYLLINFTPCQFATNFQSHMWRWMWRKKYFEFLALKHLWQMPVVVALVWEGQASSCSLLSPFINSRYLYFLLYLDFSFQTFCSLFISVVLYFQSTFLIQIPFWISCFWIKKQQLQNINFTVI